MLFPPDTDVLGWLEAGGLGATAQPIQLRPVLRADGTLDVQQWAMRTDGTFIWITLVRFPDGRYAFLGDTANPTGVSSGLYALCDLGKIPGVVWAATDLASSQALGAACPAGVTSCPTGQFLFQGKCYKPGDQMPLPSGGYCIVQNDGGCCGGTVTPCNAASGWNPGGPWPVIDLDPKNGLPAALTAGQLDPCVPVSDEDVGCAWPTRQAVRMASMPFPSGSQTLFSPSGFPCIAIPATDAVRAAQAQMVASLQANATKGLPDIHGMSSHDYYTKKAAAVADGTSYYASVQYVGEIHMDSYGALPPAGRPPVVNPQNQDGRAGWWTYSEWFAFYGAQTKGWLLLVNMPYFNVSLSVEELFPFLADPFAFLATVVGAGIEDIIHAIAALLCSSVGKVLIAGAVTAIDGKTAGAGALNIANAVCSGTPTCVAPLVLDPTTHICTQPTSPWLYAGIGVAVLGALTVGYLALRPRRKAGP
jgi:hypothetical protein